MEVAFEGWRVLLELELLEFLFNLDSSGFTLLVSPYCKLLLFRLKFHLSLFLNIIFLSTLDFFAHLLFFPLNGGHALSETNDCLVLVVGLGEVLLKDLPSKVVLASVFAALLKDFEVDSLCVELVILDLVHVKRSILRGVVDDPEFSVIPDLGLLPLVESNVVFNKSVLL